MSDPVVEQFEILKSIADGCNHFECELDSVETNLIKCRFSGKFLESLEDGKPHLNDEQKFEFQLPRGFPDQPPQVFWSTNIEHPNIDPAGKVRLADIGLNWESSMGLTVIAERLWDVARMAFVEQTDATNSSAGRWLEKNQELETPLNATQFGCGDSMKLENVFSYRRKSQVPPKLHPDQVSPQTSNGSDDVFYIGD